MPAAVISSSSSPVQRGQVGDILPVRVGLVAHNLGLGALLDPPLLVLGGRSRVDDRFGFPADSFLAEAAGRRRGPGPAREKPAAMR